MSSIDVKSVEYVVNTTTASCIVCEEGQLEKVHKYFIATTLATEY